jgi:hypothetical protein
MAHKLFCINDKKQYDITPLVGSLSWTSNTDELGVQLDFEIACNDDRYFPVNPVDLGSAIALYGSGEIFRGIVVSEDKIGRGSINYTCFDGAFYLNQSKAVYQFNGLAANQAITTMLNDFSVPVGGIAAMSTPVNKIYNDRVIADIIKDILEQVEEAAGNKYRMEMRGGSLFIEDQQDLVIAPVFQIASNIAAAACTAAITDPSRKRSIEKMKNSVKIINDNTVIAEDSNGDFIVQYGLLQEVRSNNGSADAQQAAKNLLAELGKVTEENRLELPGSDEVRAGRLIQIEEPITGMTGQYLIKSVTHTDKAGIHTMQLKLGVS